MATRRLLKSHCSLILILGGSLRCWGHGLEISRNVKNQFEVSEDDFSPEDYNHPHGAEKPTSLTILIAIAFIGAVSATLLVSLIVYIAISFIVDFINMCCRAQDEAVESASDLDEKATRSDFSHFIGSSSSSVESKSSNE